MFKDIENECEELVQLGENGLRIMKCIAKEVDTLYEVEEILKLTILHIAELNHIPYEHLMHIDDVGSRFNSSVVTLLELMKQSSEISVKSAKKFNSIINKYRDIVENYLDDNS